MKSFNFFYHFTFFIINRFIIHCTLNPFYLFSRLAQRESISPSGSSSPTQSSTGSSPLSAQARRERDRKHLDDTTAAKLPPLHHSPAQLLSLEESAALLKEQTKKQQVSEAVSSTDSTTSSEQPREVDK